MGSPETGTFGRPVVPQNWVSLAETDLVVALEEALIAPYGRFTFERTGKPLNVVAVRTVRIEVAVRFDGSPWTTVAIDISPHEGHVLEIEPVAALDLQACSGSRAPRSCRAYRFAIIWRTSFMGQRRPGMMERKTPGFRTRSITGATERIREFIRDIESSQGIGFVPFIPLGRGFLTGTIAPNVAFDHTLAPEAASR
jgi:hypothetical protein